MAEGKIPVEAVWKQGSVDFQKALDRLIQSVYFVLKNFFIAKHKTEGYKFVTDGVTPLAMPGLSKTLLEVTEARLFENLIIQLKQFDLIDYFNLSLTRKK